MSKAHSLIGRITPQLVRQAFLTVKRNRGAAGAGKVSIKMFRANLRENLDALMSDLKSGEYRPSPLLRRYIRKGPRTKKTRPLGIPVVRDRVAQEVLRRLLSPIFEPLFHDGSHGFRKKHNCHMAIEHVLKFHDDGYLTVLDADIKGFFDNLPHRVIMDSVCQKVADGKVLDLIQRFLTAGVMEDGVFKPTTVGTPQGGVISPLLANIALNHLDWQLDAAGYRFVRYADDFVVLCGVPLRGARGSGHRSARAWGRSGTLAQPREDAHKDVKARIRFSRIHALVAITSHAREVTAEVQGQGARADRAAPQSGR